MLGRDHSPLRLAMQQFQITFTIRASKDGETIEMVRTGPTATVAKARGLFKTGWMVRIVDSGGSTYAPVRVRSVAFVRSPRGHERNSKRQRSGNAGKNLG
jgi:hypothetical protein